MSTVVSLRLSDDELSWLKNQASKHGKSVSQIGALLIEQQRREDQFPGVEYRDTLAGRLLYVKGSRVRIPWFARIARDHDFDPERIADYFPWPLRQVEGALAYYRAFAAEIDAEIIEEDKITVDDLKRMLPSLEIYECVDDEIKRVDA